MKLTEKLDELPIKTTMNFIECFFEAYNQYDKIKYLQPYVYSKYGEEEYIKLVRTKQTKAQMLNACKKMIPRTKSYVVFNLIAYVNKLQLNKLKEW